MVNEIAAIRAIPGANYWAEYIAVRNKKKIYYYRPIAYFKVLILKEQFNKSISNDLICPMFIDLEGCAKDSREPNNFVCIFYSTQDYSNVEVEFSYLSRKTTVQAPSIGHK